MSMWSPGSVSVAFGLLVILAAGCASDDPPAEAPKECKVCSPGARTCVGATSVLCADDGRSATAEPCLAGQVCDAATGACAASSCPAPGARECAGADLSVCKGANMVTEPCPTDTACVSGACVPATCADGDTACGFGVVLTCAGGAWTEGTKCGAGEVCSAPATGAACVAQKCDPGAPICADADGDGTFETALSCALDGSGPVLGDAVDCAKLSGTCDQGLCTCAGTGGGADAGGIGGPDGAIADAGSDAGPTEDVAEDVFVPQPDVPVLQKPDKASATLNGEQVDFDSLGVANWIAQAGEDGPSEFGILQIKLAAGTRTMEIQIAPTTVGWTGSINSDAGGDIVGFIGYNDATVPGADFTHGAGTYPKGTFPGSWDITIEENGGFGGRVSGTFFGTLSHVAGGSNLEVLEGTFDVHHSN